MSGQITVTCNFRQAQPSGELRCGSGCGAWLPTCIVRCSPPCVPDGAAAARLHRHVGLPMLAKAGLDHTVSRGEPALRIAGGEALVRHQVVGHGVVDQRRAGLPRPRRCPARRQRSRSPPRRVPPHPPPWRGGLGDHAGHQVAVEAHLARRQGLDRRPAAAPRSAAPCAAAGSIARSPCPCRHGDDARHGPRGVGIDRYGCGHGRAASGRSGRAARRETDVVEIAPLPGQEAAVLSPRHASADFSESELGSCRVGHGRAVRVAKIVSIHGRGSAGTPEILPPGAWLDQGGTHWTQPMIQWPPRQSRSRRSRRASASKPAPCRALPIKPERAAQSTFRS